jgi:hypothetical protein
MMSINCLEILNVQGKIYHGTFHIAIANTEAIKKKSGTVLTKL